MKRILPLIVLTASPAAAFDTCLAGTWQADGRSMAGAMAAQTGAVVEHKGGQATLQIGANGAMNMTSDAMVFAMTMSGMPEMQVAVNGYSRGSIEADGNSYTAQATEFSLVGSANVMGQQMEIPVTSAGGTGWGNSTGTYACDGDTLQFEASQSGTIPPRFERVR